MTQKASPEVQLSRNDLEILMGALMSSETKTEYHHLEARPCSNYRTLWLKGRRIRAAVVDETVNAPNP